MEPIATIVTAKTLIRKHQRLLAGLLSFTAVLCLTMLVNRTEYLRDADLYHNLSKW